MPCLYDEENDLTEENDESKGVIVDADLVAEKRPEERVHEGRGWPDAGTSKSHPWKTER